MTPKPSSWINFPTPENPSSRYKFIGLDFTFNTDMIDVNRKTYSFLDWLGDTGGLVDGLFLLANIFVAPISQLDL